MLNGLNADQELFAAELAWLKLDTTSWLSVVQLYKALGGAWQQSVSSAKPKKLVGSV